MIFDVEPLVAYWDSGQEVPDQWSNWRRREATAYGALPGFPSLGWSSATRLARTESWPGGWILRWCCTTPVCLVLPRGRS